MTFPRGAIPPTASHRGRSARSTRLEDEGHVTLQRRPFQSPNLVSALTHDDQDEEDEGVHASSVAVAAAVHHLEGPYLTHNTRKNTPDPLAFESAFRGRFYFFTLFFTLVTD